MELCERLRIRVVIFVFRGAEAVSLLGRVRPHSRNNSTDWGVSLLGRVRLIGEFPCSEE